VLLGVEHWADLRVHTRHFSMSEASVQALAGAGGGMVALITTYPLTTITTRQAVKTHDSKHRRDVVERSKSTLAALEEAISTRGIGSLYQGIGPALVGTAASQSVYNFFYFLLRNHYVARRNRLDGTISEDISPLTGLGLATIAGCINVLATNPIWVAVTRLQVARRKHGASDRTLLQELQAMVNDNGFAGLYKGVLPSLILVSNPALTYMILEWFQNLFSESANGRKGKMSAGSTFARNAAAKLLATIITYPVMVLKSRLQVSKQKNLDEAQPQLKYRNILDAIVKIVRRVTSSDGGDAQAAAHRQCCCVPCRKDLVLCTMESKLNSYKVCLLLR